MMSDEIKTDLKERLSGQGTLTGVALLAIIALLAKIAGVAPDILTEDVARALAGIGALMGVLKIWAKG